MILLASGCAHAHAKAAPDLPGLEVPAPPPRDVDSAEPETTPAVMPPAADASRGGAPRPRPATPRPEPTSGEQPRAPEPAKAEEAPRAPTPLQTTPANAEADLAREIRATLARATADLNRVDYRHLNTDARTQYDSAKRFIRQADDAVRARNLVFARTLADKAAALAAQLSAR